MWSSHQPLPSYQSICNSYYRVLQSDACTVNMTQAIKLHVVRQSLGNQRRNICSYSQMWSVWANWSQWIFPWKKGGAWGDNRYDTFDKHKQEIEEPVLFRTCKWQSKGSIPNTYLVCFNNNWIHFQGCFFLTIWYNTSKNSHIAVFKQEKQGLEQESAFSPAKKTSCVIFNCETIYLSKLKFFIKPHPFAFPYHSTKCFWRNTV